MSGRLGNMEGLEMPRDSKVNPSNLNEIVNDLRDQVDALIRRVKDLEDRTYEEVADESA